MRTEALLDAGYLWDINSLYHPLQSNSAYGSIVDSISDSEFKWLGKYLSEYSGKYHQPTDTAGVGLNLLLLSGVGSDYQRGSARAFDNIAFQPYFLIEAKFRDHWYGRIYIRATNEEESPPHFSGIPRDISRFGLNAGEFDQSVMGYQDKWVNIEYGRSREIWGPMVENNLVLSGYSPPYERFLAQLSLGKIKFRYFFGFLETVVNEDFINRYITGRSIQYSNRENLVVGVSEVSILAGPYRPIDLAFLNPLSFHLENDANDHSTSGNQNYDNAIWSLFWDWRLFSSVRFSGSLSMDEFQLDFQDREQGRPDATGYLARLAWTPYQRPVGITFIANYTRLDTYFGQHEYPYTNFVNRNVFLGNSTGNDADKLSAGIRFTFKFPTLAEIEVGRYRWGDNSLLENPYTPFIDFISLPFPSGEKRENLYLALRLNSQPWKCLSCSFDGQIDLSNSGEESSMEKYLFVIRYQLPIYLTKL
jgi:hypothetical protein